MIEVTADLVEVAQAATCRAESDECMAAALEAAFAVLGRDYEVRPRANPSWCSGSATMGAWPRCGRRGDHSPHDRCARIDCDHRYCNGQPEEN